MPPSSLHMDQVRRDIAALRAERTEPAARPADTAAAEGVAASDEGMSFWDVLDIVNPLQHIPVVNKIYRAVTGDTIGQPAKIAGSALFFGPVGMAVAAADAIVEKQTGRDTVDNVASLIGIGGGSDTPPAAEEDPFTVTAPRPQAMAAAPIPPMPASGQGAIPELNAGQAALLESLMQPADRPAALGGIGTPQQLKSWQSVPGTSAAQMAAAGLGAGAAVASLPAPGTGGGGDMVAALGDHPSSAAKTGRGLADYRANSVSRGSMAPKPLVPSSAVQMAQQAGSMAAQPRAHSVMPAPTAPARIIPEATAPMPAATDAAAEAPVPVSKDKMAEMMLMGISKYEAQQRSGSRGPTPSPLPPGAF